MPTKKKTAARKPKAKGVVAKKKGEPGKKSCPKCKKSVGVRTQKCECGYVFPVKSKAAKVTSKKDPFDLVVQLQNQIGYDNMMNLFELVKVYGDANIARTKIRQLQGMMK